MLKELQARKESLTDQSPSPKKPPLSPVFHFQPDLLDATQVYMNKGINIVSMCWHFPPFRWHISY